MNKFIFTVCAFLYCTLYTKAQDTLLFENFQNDMSSYMLNTLNPPPGNTIDTYWYNYDLDQLTADVNGNGTSGYWAPGLAFADVDSLTGIIPEPNIVMQSNSWFSPVGQADNWLITPNITLGDHDTLYWKSAPYQTPRYLDGYEIRISTSTNDDFSFPTVLQSFAEMTDTSAYNNRFNFNAYTFSPGFVHGLDGTYTEFHTDSAHLMGVLRPFSIPLDVYANQNIFLAFRHTSFDDNLISIDDILIRGTSPSSLASVAEKTNNMDVKLFPNPTTDNVNLNYTLSCVTPVIINVYDVSGKLVYAESSDKQLQGRHFFNINTSELTKGFYVIKLRTNYGQSTSKLIIK